MRFDAPRWAWVEYRLSQGGAETGLAAWAALQAGGRWQDWRAAFAALDGDDPEQERAAVHAAQRHGLWALAGAR